MSKENNQPVYLKRLEYQKGVTRAFILEGNVHDIYPVSACECSDTSSAETPVGNIEYEDIYQLLYRIFDSGNTSGKYRFMFCNPLTGFNDPLNNNVTEELIAECDRLIAEEKTVENRLNNNKSGKGTEDTGYNKVAKRIHKMLTGRIQLKEEDAKSTAVVVDYASRYLLSPEAQDTDEQAFFMQLLDAVNHAIRGNTYINTLILLVDKVGDLPRWFVQNNPHVCILSFHNPDSCAREAYFKSTFPAFGEMNDSTPDDTKELFNKVVLATDGMQLVGIDNIRRIFCDRHVSIDELPDIISICRYGFQENPWISIRKRVGNNLLEKLEKRVKGQGQVLENVAQMLEEVLIGMSGSEDPSGEANEPKAVCLCVGPTGTGKTELSKTIAELLFGDPNKMIRFDLGEYSEEASVQKLFGPPPGYIGYSEGGQLTNAMKNNPVCVILFDELEKAHPKVLNSLLQVLDGGRLTDCFGCTVSFANAIIIFTSNAGMTSLLRDPVTGLITRRENVHPGDTYEDIENAARKGLETALAPEFLNRFGQNIFTFNYIDEENTMKIIHSKVENINKWVCKRFKINISVGDDVYWLLFQASWKDAIRKYGGRGIVNNIKYEYRKKLSKYLYKHECAEGCKLYADVADGEVVFREVE